MQKSNHCPFVSFWFFYLSECKKEKLLQKILNYLVPRRLQTLRDQSQVVRFRRLLHCWMRQDLDFPALFELASYNTPESVWGTICGSQVDVWKLEQNVSTNSKKVDEWLYSKWGSEKALMGRELVEDARSHCAHDSSRVPTCINLSRKIGWLLLNQTLEVSLGHLLFENYPKD